MKTIRFIAATVMCLLSLTTNAQATMRIEFEGGKQVDYPVSTITSIKWFTNETNPDISPSGVQAVDLGLSVKWATMNVGATSPEGYGDYFAWGDTEPYYTEVHSQDNPCSSWKTGKTGYNWASYKWCKGTYTTMTKYCTSSGYGTVDNKTTLEIADDAAHVNWGGSWRMPTKAEQDELRTKCTWTWTTQNGVYGRKVVGPNGNFIFLPAAGCRGNSDLDDAGSGGSYWSSSLYTSYSDRAYCLSFNSGGVSSNSSSRYYGRSVRAVCP